MVSQGNTEKNRMWGKKWGAGYLWNFQKRPKNGEDASFLAKDDAYQETCCLRLKNSDPGEGSKIWPGLGSKRGWELDFFANDWLKVDPGSIVGLGIFN